MGAVPEGQNARQHGLSNVKTGREVIDTTVDKIRE